MKRKYIALLALMSVSQLFVEAQSPADLKVLNIFHISGAGGWDYLAVGPVNDWLYVSHSTQVNIINKKTGDSVGVLANTPGIHGIAFDAANKEGFTSNGRLNNVSVFDLYSNEIITQIPTGQNPDAIIYEPFSKKIFTCNGRSNNLSIIDPVSLTLIDSIAVGGRPEEAVSDGKGKVFVNIEDKSEIVEINTKTFKVVHRWSLAPGEGPSGLAFDPKTNRLFAGCDKKLIVLDAGTGKMIADVSIGDGCDGVAFAMASSTIFTSNGGDGTITVIKEISADKYKIVENAISKPGARTIAPTGVD